MGAIYRKIKNWIFIFIGYDDTPQKSSHYYACTIILALFTGNLGAFIHSAKAAADLGEWSSSLVNTHVLVGGILSFMIIPFFVNLIFYNYDDRREARRRILTGYMCLFFITVVQIFVYFSAIIFFHQE